MVSKRLNPLAPAFLPAWLTGSGDKSTVSSASPADNRGFGLLPDEVLASVLGCISRPQDVMSLSAASGQLRHIARHAPLNLRICSPKAYPTSPSGEQERQVRMTLHGVMNAFKGVQTLDLSHTLIDDVDIIRVLKELPHLRILNLAGCRKLTSTGLDITQPTTGQRLEFLSLQRCFQAKDDVLSELLATAASSKQTLRCIAVSHLQLQQWATSSDLSTELNMSVQSGTVQEMEATQTVPKQLHASVRQSSQLYALALHNCQGITSAGLQAVVTACPQLQMLLLGGSNLSIPLSMTMCSIATAAAGIPMLNSIPRSRAATITTLLQRAPARRHPAARQIATELAALTQQLPQLMLLEVTFLPHGVREELKGLLENRDTDMRADTGSSNRACKVHVLDFCECSSIAAAATRHSELYQHAVDASAAAGAQRQQHFRLLLEAAANCSNAARQTPLHMAIDRKDPEAVEGLLQLGSGINSRDRGGATPLFVACEGGHAACASLMLQAGADVLLRNTSGEAPLYIAALRGEDRVVDVLLQHMQSEGICWQDGKLYGDGWTPLMAAAVADRHGIAVRLLSAAGAAVDKLVRHANRYGQTAVHIAARKGSLPMLRALLNIGGPAVALARDCVGTSPKDIASKHNHAAAVELLCAVAANKSMSRTYCHTQQVVS